MKVSSIYTFNIYIKIFNVLVNLERNKTKVVFRSWIGDESNHDELKFTEKKKVKQQQQMEKIK